MGFSLLLGACLLLLQSFCVCLCFNFSPLNFCFVPLAQMIMKVFKNSIWSSSSLLLKTHIVARNKSCFISRPWEVPVKVDGGSGHQLRILQQNCYFHFLFPSPCLIRIRTPDPILGGSCVYHHNAVLLYDVCLEFKTPLSLKVTWLVTPLDLIQSLT